MICKKCGQEKDLSNFRKDIQRKSGYYPYCRDCANIASTEYRKKFPCKQILISIKQRCNNSNNKAYKYYGLRGIKCLITEEEIKRLMIRDNYWDLKEPTIDRIDNNGHYTFDNCRFIENSLNRKKSHIDNPRNKKILQYDLNGNFIREWDSIKKASIELQIHPYSISACAKNKRKTAGNFIWEYKK